MGLSRKLTRRKATQGLWYRCLGSIFRSITTVRENRKALRPRKPFFELWGFASLEVCLLFVFSFLFGLSRKTVFPFKLFLSCMLRASLWLDYVSTFSCWLISEMEVDIILLVMPTYILGGDTDIWSALHIFYSEQCKTEMALRKICVRMNFEQVMG